MRPESPPPKPNDIKTPGLTWRPRADHWVGYWVASRNAVKRRYPIKSRQVWPPSETPTLIPSDEDWLSISSTCVLLQDEMSSWGKSGSNADPFALFDDTLSSLIMIFLNDKDSPFQNLRHHTKIHYESKLASITRAVGYSRVSSLTFRDFKRWHEGWRKPVEHGGPERISRAHSFMAFVRIAFSFGTLLKLPGCADAKRVLDEMEFKNPKRRSAILTSEQAAAIRTRAHDEGLHSIALVQALQSDLMVRQKEALGEWIPENEPGLSEVMAYGDKWVVGFRWNEVDDKLKLKHRLSKSIRGRTALANADEGKVKTWNLNLYPMVVEELCRIAGVDCPAKLRRELLPASGPIVVAEHTGVPWRQKVFAEKWRKIARAVGVPDSVQNRDSRAGGATEVDNLNIDVEFTRKALGHSKVETTRIYTRNEDEATEQVALLRWPNREHKSE